MASISSTGIGSGLDISALLKQIMEVESQPLTALNTKEATYQSKLTAYGTLKGAVSSVQSAARALKSSTLYGSMTAKSADTAIFSATSNTAAQAGTYSINVVAKAQAQSISSQAFGSITSDLATSAGKLKLELGSFSDGVFTTDESKKAITLDIDPTKSSLEEIRDQINGANAGVRANLVYVGDAGYKLTLTSLDTGAKNSIKLTAMDANGDVLNDNTGLAKLSFDPAAAAGSGNEFSVNTAAQDAHVKIDGLDVYRSTNSFSDAITGVTLNLASTGTTTLTVGKDSAAAKAALETFVKAYNDANTQLRNMTAYNAETKTASILTGDSGARSLQTMMRDMINFSRPTRSAASGSELSTLSDLGISLQRDGSLQFNSAKFDTAMTASSSVVGDLLGSTATGSPGLAARMTSTLDGILSSTGLLSSKTEGINRSIKDLGSRREVLARRLTQIETRYRTQFTSLDTLVASMKKTSEYLSQQLGSLNSSS